jgi:hypothetical protein
MNIHYFQRYHSQENVHTANAMLLLGRLYDYSPAKFYQFLLQYILPDADDIELSITLQEKIQGGTVPDAAIAQNSFKIVVETKRYGQFEIGQLEGHLKSFRGENHQVLLTLAPERMSADTKKKLDKKLGEYNRKNISSIVHCNLTFEELIKWIDDVLDERDFQMHDLIEDYRGYCEKDGLISDYGNRMRVKAAVHTFDDNQQLRVFYEKAKQGSSKHDYLGLYNNKAVRLIGKIEDVIVALPSKPNKNGAISDITDITVIKGSLDDEKKNRIVQAINASVNYYADSLMREPHKYYLVDEFYDTRFEKKSKGGLWGTRFFDLCEELDVSELPSTAEIAKLLKHETWQ